MEDYEIDETIIDAKLFKTKYPGECEKLPFEYLEDEERELAEKCINLEELTADEKSKVKALLARYRPFLAKYDVQATEKNMEDNFKIIKTSSDLLRLLHDPNRYRIDMLYRIGNETVKLKIKIKELPDEDYINLINAQSKIFKDLSPAEKKVFTKASNNQILTPEEENMQKAIMDKIQERSMDYTQNAVDITEMLAKVAFLVDDPEKTYEENLAFWNEIDLPSRVLLFTRIREQLNIFDKSVDDLFPDVR